MRALRGGLIIKGPEEKAYRVTRTILMGEALDPSAFEPLNGAPKPIAGEPMEPWLFDEIQRLSEQREP